VIEDKIIKDDKKGKKDITSGPPIKDFDDKITSKTK
jgi:hypothetical protein